MDISQPTFKFNHGQQVAINVSGEHGQVRARSDSIESTNQYRVAYKSAQGEAKESWWAEDQLSAA